MTPAGNKESQKTTRARAAEARAKAEAQQRRRDARNRILGGIVIVVLIGLIFGGVWWSKRDASTGSSTTPTANPDAALPKGVDPVTYGVPFGTGTDAVPQLQLWEDFQCPACKQLEATNGSGITALAQKGTIRLLWRPTTFLDQNLRNDSSARAAAAWGCAIDEGKAQQYHSTVFANQPKEGVGYTDAQLLQFGKDAGIAGDAYSKFESCVKANTYTGWVTNSYLQFQDDAVPGTPTGFLVMAGKDPKEVPAATMADQGKLEQAIQAYAAS